MSTTTMDTETHAALDGFFAGQSEVVVHPASETQIMTQAVVMPVQGFMGRVGRFLHENSNEGMNEPSISMPKMALDPADILGGPEIEVNLATPTGVAPDAGKPAVQTPRKPGGFGLS